MLRDLFSSADVSVVHKCRKEACPQQHFHFPISLITSRRCASSTTVSSGLVHVVLAAQYERKHKLLCVQGACALVLGGAAMKKYAGQGCLLRMTPYIDNIILCCVHSLNIACMTLKAVSCIALYTQTH
eukprot:scaffold62582_cov26-Tisochrysis_lutea.AAC.2